MNTRQLIEQTQEILYKNTRHTLAEASAWEAHNALGEAVMVAVAPAWQACEDRRSEGRQAAYISCEYLMGRMVANNLLCLGVLEDVRSQLAAKGFSLDAFEQIEDDAFGNGGLGRLAACFLDSAASLDVPLIGYGLRYRYGLFRQDFAPDGSQLELPDDWSRLGDPWSVRREDLSVVVPMKTGDVRAVPYDMPIIGWQGRSIGTLRLWQTESLRPVDFRRFNDQDYRGACADQEYAEDIVKFLYPNDTRPAGKLMRVKQQYVLSSATVQDILRRYRSRHGGDWGYLDAEWAVQLNDTHPVMAIAEMIRLLEAEGLSFDEAFSIARQVFSYTNHTVMQEALEKWDLALLRRVCPDLVAVIRKIDALFCRVASDLGQATGPDFCILEHGRVHMAHLAVFATHKTNGVAEIHSDILRQDLFRRFHALWPERFDNKTNGVSQRRWLALCNPQLLELIRAATGADVVADPEALSLLAPQVDDALATEFLAVKRTKKAELRRLILAREDVDLPESFVFDVQIKRLHEYKRQLMNALCILLLYRRLRDGQLPDLPPTACVFGAKAAPGYTRAKAIIRLVNQIAREINADPRTNDRLRVVFARNYNCSLAEAIIPAADISEQISAAGTEASGTGNMKLMLNGAVTLGTMDGANIEIVREAGRENNYIFGADAQELRSIRETYDPREILAADDEIREAFDLVAGGHFDDPDGSLGELCRSLTDGASWHRPDHYFVLRDLRPYFEARLQAIRDTGNALAFARKCLLNVSAAGRFSSDRTIREYARDVWNIL